MFFNKHYLPGNFGKSSIDAIEEQCTKRALDLFDLDSSKWGCLVHAVSGAPANFHVYNGVLQPGDRILGLKLSSGGVG